MATTRATTSTRAAPRVVARSRWMMTTRVSRVSRVAHATTEEEDGDDDVGKAPEARGAAYYKGFVTEPVKTTAREFEGEARDIWTPTINLVTRSAGVLTALFVGFLASNGLPPFDK